MNTTKNDLVKQDSKIVERYFKFCKANGCTSQSRGVSEYCGRHRHLDKAIVKQDANTRNVHNETREGWYCFETLVAGQRKYLGKALTTHEAIKYAMPWSDIVGNLVTIYAKPPQHAKRLAHIRRNASRVSTAAT